MKHAVVLGLMMFSAQAFATATLDCVAEPYHLSVIVSIEDGPQQFSLWDDKGELVAGEMKLWKVFQLHWPNGLGPKGNSILFRGEFPNNLAVAGTVRGAKGTLVVNGAKHVLKCDWRK